MSRIRALACSLALVSSVSAATRDGLDLRLFSSSHGTQRLGDFLLPLRDGEVFEGCVIQLNKTPAINARTLTFTFDQFVTQDAATVGSDGDFIFYIQLDTDAQLRLRQHVGKDVGHLIATRALLQWPNFNYSVLHVEAVPYARSLLNRSTPLFRGWRESGVAAALMLNGNPIAGQLDCAQFDTANRCSEPRLNNNSLVGMRVRATGLLAIDCNDFGVVAGCPSPGAELELHPVYALEITGNCH